MERGIIKSHRLESLYKVVPSTFNVFLNSNVDILKRGNMEMQLMTSLALVFKMCIFFKN